MRALSRRRALCLGVAASFAAAPAAPGPNGFSLETIAVEADRIIVGGPPRDGIRSIDAPTFAAPELATWVKEETPVLGVALGGEARAYPVHVIDHHQVVNDQIGGVDVAVTYDPLAGSPRVYRRTVGERTLTFGVSGLIFNSNFLLYDRETESLWSQFDGRALAGPLVGQTLQELRVRQEDMAAWLQRHPETRVLERPESRAIDYRYSPYEAYWVSEEVPFPVAAEDRSYHPKELVLGVTVGDHQRAYLGSILTAAGGKIRDTFHGHEIRIGYSTELARYQWEAPAAVEVDEAYWFAWKAFHPDTEVWQPRP